MSTTAIVVIIVAIVAVLLVARRGTRVTHIDTRRDSDGDRE